MSENNYSNKVKVLGVPDIFVKHGETEKLKESIDKGLEFLSKLGGDYMIVDGQDATSLVGTIDVFRESNALLFLKNSYLYNSVIC